MAYEFQIDNVVDYDEARWCNILIRGAKLTVRVVYRCPLYYTILLAM